MAATVAAAFWLLPATASAQSIRADTNKGGSCRLEPLLFPGADAITYGGRVWNCSTRFGVRRVHARSLLYEQHNKLQVDVTQRESGDAPFEQLKTFEDEAEPPLRARFEVSIVLEGRRTVTRPRNPERWRNPHRRCRISTTRHAGDTLRCSLQVRSGGSESG